MNFSVEQILEDNIPEQQLSKVKRVIYGRDLE
jgi:hypothetical protein